MDEHCRGCIRYLKSCSGLSKAVCEKHQLRIPRTNADRIRSMTDEELAAKIEELCQYAFMQISVYAKPFGKAEWLEWLKQEVGDGNHDH